MNYYKLINGTEYIGVADSTVFCKYSFKHNRWQFCGSDTAECILCNDTFFSAEWMHPPVPVPIVTIEQITKEEYDELKAMEELGETPEIESPDDEVEIPVEQIDTATLEYVRNTKIKQFSKFAQSEIENGFDATIGNEEKHFSLTAQDQINLKSAENLITSGEERIAYHADGEPFVFYSAEDMSLIVSMAIWHINLIQARFNCMREYIMNMDDKSEIVALNFYDKIPEEYMSEVYLDIMNGSYLPVIKCQNPAEIEDFLDAVLGGSENESE